MPVGRENRHLLIFLGATVGLLGVCSALSFLVNPSGVFDHEYIQPIVWIDRDQKAVAFKALPTRPQALVLGSSRSMKINPAEIYHRTGLTAFNFAVNSATVDDYTAIVQYCLGIDGVAIKRIFIGIDPEAFHNRWPIDGRLLRSRNLGAYVGAPTPSLFEDFIGASAIEWSLRSLYHQIRVGAEPPSYVFGPDGFLTERALDEEVQLGTFRLEPRLASSTTEYRSRFDNFTTLDKRRRKKFESLLQQAKTAGIRVDAFVSPLHPQLVQALADTTYPQRIQDVRNMLVDLHRRGLLRYCDVHDVGVFGGNPRDFFDGAHMMELNATKLLAYVLSCKTEGDVLQ